MTNIRKRIQIFDKVERKTNTQKKKEHGNFVGLQNLKKKDEMLIKGESTVKTKDKPL